MADAAYSFSPVINGFAQQWFVIEMLKARQGELTGKLRFDIAPLSTVKIESARENFVPGDALGAPLYGTVLRVTIAIDAERRTAGSGYTIAHIRSEAENSDGRTSVDKPPMYKEPFVGCALIDGA